MSDFKHCNDYIHDHSAPRCLRFFLLVQRLPAADKALMYESGVRPRLFADYDGKRVRVVMASRLGDLGITLDPQEEFGYRKRVAVSELSNFSEES